MSTNYTIVNIWNCHSDGSIQKVCVQRSESHHPTTSETNFVYLLVQPFGHFGLEPDTDLDNPPFTQVMTFFAFCAFAFGAFVAGETFDTKVVVVLVEVVAFDTGIVTAVLVFDSSVI